MTRTKKTKNKKREVKIMKELKKVSRWIKIEGKYITPKHSLYEYAEKVDGEDRERYLQCFRHGGREYALEQFLSRFGIAGFDRECKEYPDFITGYDAESYYNPLLIELDKYGEKVRLWTKA